MTKRKIILSFEDFKNCLKDGPVKCSSFSDSVSETFTNLKLGAFVVVLEGYENKTEKKMFLVMWRGKGESVDCLVTKVDKEGINSKLDAIKTATTKTRV